MVMLPSLDWRRGSMNQPTFFDSADLMSGERFTVSVCMIRLLLSVVADGFRDSAWNDTLTVSAMCRGLLLSEESRLLCWGTNGWQKNLT
jgi:hypothetical protein